MNENEDLKYIKNFSKITITNACKRANVDRSNLLNGRIKDSEKIKLVRKYIEEEYAKLYILNK